MDMILCASLGYALGMIATVVAVAVEVAVSPKGGCLTRVIARLVYWMRFPGL